MPNALHIALIPLLPLAAFIILGLFGRKYFNRSAGIIAVLLPAVSTALAFYSAYSYFFEYGKVDGVYEKAVAFKYTWLQFSSNMSIDIGAIMDPITALMLVVVTFISLMVHIYSLAYLKDEKRFATYYAFLGLFTFSMLGLILSSNIFQIYIFWELVGVSSFLLIGFYYDKPSAVAACKKAFIVTRFADLGFLIGILVLSFYAGSLDFVTIIEKLATPGSTEATSAVAASFLGISALSWGVALVFIGAAGKSAMFPLHIWLPDAMEGPTPVSALIHAATMVVAGVFLLARLFHVFSMSPPVMHVIGYVGAFSALFAAIIACTQTDIKRVLAYSTMSQIGFMMFALAISRATGGERELGFTGGMFHLFTHAMFKALLFLGAGSVIHYVHSNEIKDMGGLRKYMPITHITFLIACLAIAGIPPFAGFFSKEEILLAAYHSNTAVFYIALITSGLTAFYMFRLYFNIFWNKQTVLHEENHGEGGFPMMFPLIVLAAASCTAGFVPFGNFVTADGKQLPTEFHLSFSIAPVALALTGIFIAMSFYKNQNSRAEKFAASVSGFYKTAYHKFYIDEIYLFITNKVLFGMIGKAAAWLDKNVMDGLVNTTGNGTAAIAEKIKAFQSGKVQQYAIYFLAGVIGLAVIFMYLWK
jgi:NADH-quinone oxidoreductase subunit L